MLNERKWNYRSFKTLKHSRMCSEVKALRQYIDQIKQAALSENNLTDELKIWLEWIRRKADWFDPVVNGRDELFGEIDPNSLLQFVADVNPINRY